MSAKRGSGAAGGAARGAGVGGGAVVASFASGPPKCSYAITQSPFRFSQIALCQPSNRNVSPFLRTPFALYERVVQALSSVVQISMVVPGCSWIDLSVAKKRLRVLR